ncbi:MAG: penicillin-binding protein 1B [Pseudomonadota bacterium]
MATRKPSRSRRKKTTSRKSRSRRKPAKSWVRRHPILGILALVFVGFALWVLYLDMQITRTFEARRWDLPAQIFAQPLELYQGRALRGADLAGQLRALGYRQVDEVQRPGQFRRQGNRFDVYRRAAVFWDERQPARRFSLSIANDTVARLAGPGSSTPGLIRLDPLMIGSIFAAHGEDRLILAPDELPGMLTDTLRLIEDRRFDDHFGIDLRAVLRAAWVNLRAGGIRQGGSTLTQQLVKSYFLTNERSFRRKAREAVMAVLLELRFSKQEILTAYSNEIYLGQDGARAIHGFGLASQFYFAKPLAELAPAEVALLVAIVRGPSYYSPTRFVDRVRERRDRILNLMAVEQLIDDEALSIALAQPVAVAGRNAERASYYPAFVDVVRRQLARDYSADDLQRIGLRIFTTLDPLSQQLASQHLRTHLQSLADGTPATSNLEGAVVLVDPRLGEVLAVVGGRDRVGTGFNRALDARRQVGSLIKPVVYLAALQTGDWHLASMVDDEPLSMSGDDGRLWEPQNFSGEFEGSMPIARALIESVNVASVRLGSQVGVRRVAATLARLGGPALQNPFASLLLGAVEMTPIEVANVYTSLASDGLRAPLRTVREVVSADGDTLQRYPLTVSTVAGTDALFQLQTALREVMRSGTGRGATATLAPGMVTAGKTGTTNDFRDAWFAGFSRDRLAVVWVGNDDNSPTSLTGSRGALPVWSALMRDVALQGLTFSVPADTELVWINLLNGRASREECENAAALGLPAGTKVAQDDGCAGNSLGSRALQWLRDTF